MNTRTVISSATGKELLNFDTNKITGSYVEFASYTGYVRLPSQSFARIKLFYIDYEFLETLIIHSASGLAN